MGNANMAKWFTIEWDSLQFLEGEEEMKLEIEELLHPTPEDELLHPDP